jgi:D-methionine transport system ATP-binding protein
VSAVHGTILSAAPFVAFESVSRRFATRGGAQVAALDGVSLAVEKGEIFGIIGRSGAGKSTLLRMINGLERPDSGRVRVDGHDVGALDERGLVALRRKIGMIFQGFNLLSARTVIDNVALPLRFAGVRAREAQARALEALELVGLADKAQAYPSRLSGGQKQRAGIARALVTRPNLLLSDEATSALDPETTRAILDLLSDVTRKLGLTTVLITHEMEVVRAIADRVAVIDRGRIVESGPVWQVFGRPKDDVTRALLADSGAAEPQALGLRSADVVYSIGFNGVDGREPDIFALAQVLGPGARLVQGGLGRLQGRPQGRLWIAAHRVALGDPKVALARLRTIAPDAELVIEGHASDVRQSV